MTTARSGYDLVVLGAGASGLAAARAARKAGRSVALIDKAEPGGDCTHDGWIAADESAALLRSEGIELVRGWARFTSPMTEQQAYEAYGDRARVAVVTLDEMDRPRTAAHTDGYLKLIAGPRAVARHQALDRVVGVTAVMPAGGEIAAMGALAMQTNMLAGRIAQTMAPYPTYALGLRLAAARLFGEFGGRSWRPARPVEEA